MTVTVYDMFGMPIYNANYTVTNSEWNTSISTLNYKKGMYIIHININGEIVSHKINI